METLRNKLLKVSQIHGVEIKMTIRLRTHAAWHRFFGQVDDIISEHMAEGGFDDAELVMEDGTWIYGRRGSPLMKEGEA